MNKIGEWGEIYACRYLREHGYDILSSNFRCRFGEIDIICSDGKNLVFVEVKARSNVHMANPAEYVDMKKQRKIILTSSYFISQYKIDIPMRFDVIEVYFSGDDFKNYKLNHIVDAFRC
jgi:putative endonuclease